MVEISIQSPVDQPTGKRRLITELIDCLDPTRFDEFFLAVAFAKIGPLLRLDESLGRWKKAKGKISAILGVDQKGTTKEALLYAMKHFDEVRVIQASLGSIRVTFHPKIYGFVGKKDAVVYIGSNNLTVGGTEINFESFVRLRMSLPDDAAALEKVRNSWKDMEASSIALTADVLDDLLRTGAVVSETESLRRARSSATGKKPAAPASKFPRIKIVPPSPSPKGGSIIVEKLAGKPAAAPAGKPGGLPADLGAETFLIEIIPHENAEVFLSVAAVRQNPTFFKWPFTGETKPKKEAKGYPQLEPDPIVDIEVLDKNDVRKVESKGVNLNTVYYERKSEIRITVPGEIAKAVEPYSLLMITIPKDRLDVDYEFTIFTPGSPQHKLLIGSCNQKMPGGGKRARVYGWI